MDPIEEPNPVEETSQDNLGSQEEETYKQRYEQMRPEFDRTGNELKQMREKAEQYEQFLERLASDPEVQRELLQELGYELEGVEEDPNSELQQRLEMLEQGFQNDMLTRQQEKELEQLHGEVDRQIDELENELGRKIDDKELEFVLPVAFDGDEIDVKGAFRRYLELEASAQKRLVDSKKDAPQAPNGVPGDAQPNLNDKEERQAQMLKAVQEMAD